MTNKLLLVASATLAGMIGQALTFSVAPATSSASAAGVDRAAQGSDHAAHCAALAARQIGGATIDKAEFVPRDSALPPVMVKNSPEFCRVLARMSPVQGSEIRIQVWLPSNWNGKLFAFGGGGFDGGYSAANIMLAREVGQGYAGVVTDAGHDAGGEPKWALNQPQKIIDYGHRANHLGAVVAKAVVADFYGSPAQRSYFHGCSNGGRDALMLAQRYPEDYDAIAAGAPANSFTARLAAFSQMGLDFNTPAGQSLVPKLKLLNDAAVAKCDAKDGVLDGVIERPNMCRFDPAELQCKSGTGASCLSKAEVSLARTMYRGTRGRDGKLVMPGFAVGSELKWTPPPAAENMGTALYRYMVYNDRSWSPDNFVLDRDYAAGRRKMGPVLDATDPDLRPFLRRGGKLLMYHGWNDTAIPPGNSLLYHDQVLRTVGTRYSRNVRLFMLPGVEHCGQGKGPDQVDFVAALDHWSATGTAPQSLIAAKHDNRIAFFSRVPTRILRSRPICAWPRSARYKGNGSTDDAANFECR